MTATSTISFANGRTSRMSHTDMTAMLDGLATYYWSQSNTPLAATNALSRAFAGMTIRTTFADDNGPFMVWDVKPVAQDDDDAARWVFYPADKSGDGMTWLRDDMRGSLPGPDHI